MRYIKTTGQTEEEWLKLRKKSIGGSDSSPVLGFSQYRTPTDVWIDKTNPDEIESIENTAMWLGHYLEDMVRDRFTHDTGIPARADNKFRYHPEIDYLHANLDGVVSEEGKTGVFEAKTIKSYTLDKNNGEIPTDYFLQCQHNMLVTGYEFAWISFYIKDRDEFMHQKLFRIEHLIEQMLKKYKDFWENHVVPRVPPTPIASNDLIASYPHNEKGSEIEADLEIAELCMDYNQVNEDIKDLTEKKDKIKFSIEKFMEDNEALVDPDTKDVLVTNKNRRSFNEKKFTEDNPQLATKYQKLDTSKVRESDSNIYNRYMEETNSKTLRFK